MPETEDLTEAEQSAIFNAFARTTGTNNVSPLLAAVHDIVAAREAAALLEAIERIESLAGDYTNGGQTLSWQGARHCVEAVLAERDEESGR